MVVSRELVLKKDKSGLEIVHETNSFPDPWYMEYWTKQTSSWEGTPGQQFSHVNTEFPLKNEGKGNLQWRSWKYQHFADDILNFCGLCGRVSCAETKNSCGDYQI